MRQLSEHDAAYIYSDSAHANSNVTLLHIYDQSTAPGGMVRFKQILTHVESRLGRLPVFRQKLLRVPLDLDYPYWIEDEKLRHRIPRAPHRPAQARRLAPVLHPGLAHPRPAAGPATARCGRCT
jgi:hypothetical protein